MIGLVNANALTIPLRDQSVQCVVTSPPYWGLRDYGTATWQGGDPECDHIGNQAARQMKSQPGTGNAGNVLRDGANGIDRVCAKCGAQRIDAQIGLERTPAEYVNHIVQVMRECWRVLRNDGTLWLNLGDSYARQAGDDSTKETDNGMKTGRTGKSAMLFKSGNNKPPDGLKPKDLCGIPWRVAFALQEDGWYLRSDIIWHKPNPMPESVTDRPTKSHEYVFLLTKQARYYYDAEAIAEPSIYAGDDRGSRTDSRRDVPLANSMNSVTGSTRNRRSVWTVATSPYSGAHYAVFPPSLIEPMILAGTSQRGECPVCGKAWVRVVEKDTSYPDDYGNMGAHGSKWADEDKQSSGHRIQKNMNALRAAGRNHDNPFPTINTIGWQPQCNHDAEPVPQIVLDPFCGSGTTGEVCRESLRSFVGLDLSLKYLHDNALPRAALTNTQSSMSELPLFNQAALL